MKTSELTSAALDWAVAKCESLCLGNDIFGLKPIIAAPIFVKKYKPSTDWAQGGPIIEREGIDVQQVFGGGCEGSFSKPVGWRAIQYIAGGTINPKQYIAQTPLIAAMRCFVASKLGDEVEVPEELK